MSHTRGDYFGAWSEMVTFVKLLCSWAALPNMPIARSGASALCVNQNLNAVLVAGSYSYLNCADFLYVDATQAGQPWRWRTLAPMHQSGVKPGMLLLNGSEESQRILVAGGYTRTTELLTISCINSADRGQWTLITPLSAPFDNTFLVCFNGRLFAIGMSPIHFNLYSAVQMMLER